MRSATQRGFTLIELLVVIAIIGLLASIILASLQTARSRARDASRLSTMHSFENALEIYRTSVGSYPHAMSLASGCATDNNYAENWLQPLVTTGAISSISSDPSVGKCSNSGYRYCTDSNGAKGYSLLMTKENGGLCVAVEQNPQCGANWETAAYGGNLHSC